MNKVLLPTLLFWENGNSFYGSCGPIRFFIQPLPEEQQLRTEIWTGPLAKEYSQIEDTTAFPLSEEGLAQTAAWLESAAAERT